MDIAFHIPQWLLLTLAVAVGIPAACALIVFALIGAAFFCSFRSGLWR
jgi:hypothetical protein